LVNDDILPPESDNNQTRRLDYISKPYKKLNKML
jgi:hypothetical protein